jgi:hypothetical protein
MTRDELLAAGFKECKPAAHDRYDMLYQKRIRDEHGTRYFVNVNLWQHSKHGIDIADGWECEVHYNDGTVFCPEPMRMMVHGRNMTAGLALAWAADLWERLEPAYYERDDA